MSVALRHLSFPQLHRLARLERATLAEAQRDETRLRRRQLPASSGQIAELEAPLSIRARETGAARIG